MKKSEILSLILIIVLSFAACQTNEPAPDTPNALVPAVMYEGNIYCTTGEKISTAVPEEEIVGRISSTTSLSQWPSEEGQANFDAMNAPYAVTADGFVVQIADEWTLFAIRDVD